MPDQYDVQQLVAQAMVTAMSVSIMSVAMGVVMGAMGPEVMTLPAAERKGTKKALDDLRITFGAHIVDEAIKSVGSDDILALCKEIEHLYTNEMRDKYGKYAADTALKTAPPGDIRTANEIAIALARRGYGKFVEPRDVPAPVSVEAGAVRIGTIKGRKKAKPQKDTTTGIMYKSKAAAGMAVALEYGLDPSETFIWYEVIKKAPTRFVSVSPEQYEAYKKVHPE
jgi:hypothetical protein